MTLPYQQPKRASANDTFGHVHDKGLLIFDEEGNGMATTPESSSAGATANTSQSTQPTPPATVFTPSNSDYSSLNPQMQAKSNSYPAQQMPQPTNAGTMIDMPFNIPPEFAPSLFAPSPNMSNDDFQRMTASLFPAGMGGTGQTPTGNFSMGQTWDMGDAGVPEEWQNMMEGVTNWAGMDQMDQTNTWSQNQQ